MIVIENSGTVLGQCGNHDLVIDPQGRVLTDFYLDGGDIHVAPFRPSGPGMYFIYMNILAFSDNLCTVDFKLDSVTPEVIPFGGFVRFEEGEAVYYPNEIINLEHEPKEMTFNLLIWANQL